MNEILTHYMTGSPDDFQDFLEHPACTLDDKNDALVKIGQEGWDECVEILVSRDSSILLTKAAAQSWVHMAGNGHTDAWMQMVLSFYQGRETNPGLWNQALEVGRDDAKLEKHWEVYALSTALQSLAATDMPVGIAQMALIGMRIELLHGLDPETSTQEMADAFASKHLAQASNTKTVDNVLDEFNFA